MRRRAGMVAAAVAGLLIVSSQLGATGAGGMATRVAVDQSYPVPGSGTYTVRGHGYGHGHGMSQWGAQGAALQGLGYRAILDFYYPGTTLTTTDYRIRVLISGDPGSDVVVLPRSGLKVRDLGADVSYPLPTNLGASRWRLAVDGQNRAVVEYLAGGTWRRWSPGGAAALQGEGEFRAPGPLTLVTPSSQRTYRGWLRAAKPSPTSGDRETVNVVGMNGYVRGVVPSEVYTSWRPAALQAQAVAARTYAAFDRAAHLDRYYQTCDTTSCQVYGGVDNEVASTDDAVRATAGEILTYGGRPAFTQFSASSGGWTSAGGFPYLPAKADPYDATAGNPNHSWSVKLSANRIQQAYPSLGRLQRIRVTARDGHGQWQGRVLSLSLVGTRNTVRLSGDDFRWKFGLKSTWLSFS